LTSATHTDRTLKCRIDPTLPVNEAVKLLALNFKSSEPFSTLALRNERDELITDDNLAAAVKEKVKLK
jgi:engulfment/cell motility protein 1